MLLLLLELGGLGRTPQFRDLGDGRCSKAAGKGLSGPPGVRLAVWSVLWVSSSCGAHPDFP